MLPSLTSAIRLLTILAWPGRESSRFVDSLSYFPIVGAILGCLVTAIALLCNAISPQWTALPALAALTSTIILTRALHLDGLADCADGFWGGFTIERRLEIMKDSRIGAFGVIALLLLLIAKFSTYQEIIESENIRFIPLAFIASRLSLVPLALLFNYPRKKGTAHDIVNGAKPKHLILALLFTIALIAYAPITGIIILSTSIILALAIGLFSRTKIGGITGDVLGASCEITELTALIIICNL